MYPGRIDAHGISLPGVTNDTNHDHFAIADLAKSMRLHQSSLVVEDETRMHGRTQGQVFLVADGVDEAPHPDRASGTAVTSVVRYFLDEMPWYHLVDGTAEEVELALADALANAQTELLRRGDTDGRAPGSMLTVAFVSWPDLYVAHIGSCTCFLQRDGELRQLTAEPTSRGRRLFRRTGPEPEVTHVELVDGDVLALCTDGVTRTCPRAELERVLGAAMDSERMCGELLRGRTPDDRTVVVARWTDTASPPASLVVPDSPPPRSARRPVPRPPRVPRLRVRPPESGEAGGDEPAPREDPLPTPPPAEVPAPKQEPTPEKEAPAPVRMPPDGPQKPPGIGGLAIA